MAKKILIVEDEATLNKALMEFLTGEGFEILSALDGEKGLEMAKKDNPDLILLDLLMPKMDGFAVLKELKERKIVLPVIITSNLGQEEDK